MEAAVNVIKKPECVTFLLDPAYSCEQRSREMEEVGKRFHAQGRKYCIKSLGENDGEHPKEERSRLSFSDLDELVLTDSACKYEEEKREGRRVAGYLHAGNGQEKFPPGAYLVEEPQCVDADSYCKIWQRLSSLPWIIASTERLVIREMVQEDLDGLYALYDDEARRFLEPPSGDYQKEREILEAYIEKIYPFFGYGMWAVCDVQSGDLIGRVGFEPYRGDGKVLELGFLVRKDKRNKGIAKEALSETLRFARESMGVDVVGARTSKDNAASIALLISLGFREADQEVDGQRDDGIRYFLKMLSKITS